MELSVDLHSLMFALGADFGEQEKERIKLNHVFEVKCTVLNITHVGKRLRESDHGYSLGCEVPLER